MTSKLKPLSVVSRVRRCLNVVPYDRSINVSLEELGVRRCLNVVPYDRPIKSDNKAKWVRRCLNVVPYDQANSR